MDGGVVGLNNDNLQHHKQEEKPWPTLVGMMHRPCG